MANVLGLALKISADASQLKLHFATWKRILKVGLPAGGEFALMFVYMALIYVIIKDVGADAKILVAFAHDSPQYRFIEGQFSLGTGRHPASRSRRRDGQAH